MSRARDSCASAPIASDAPRAADAPAECLGCGYDLSGAGSRRCPECGLDIEETPLRGALATRAGLLALRDAMRAWTIAALGQAVGCLSLGILLGFGRALPQVAWLPLGLASRAVIFAATIATAVSLVRLSRALLPSARSRALFVLGWSLVAIAAAIEVIVNIPQSAQLVGRYESLFTLASALEQLASACAVGAVVLVAREGGVGDAPAVDPRRVAVPMAIFVVLAILPFNPRILAGVPIWALQLLTNVAPAVAAFLAFRAIVGLRRFVLARLAPAVARREASVGR